MWNRANGVGVGCVSFRFMLLLGVYECGKSALRMFER